MVSRMISLRVECGSTEIQGRGLGKQARLRGDDLDTRAGRAVGLVRSDSSAQ
jgi:hypothetical protein